MVEPIEKTGVAKEDLLPNPWGSSLDKLKEWDPKGADLLLRVGRNKWTSGVLPRKGKWSSSTSR